MTRFREYVTRLSRPLRILLILWLIVDVVLAVVVNLYGQTARLQQADVIVVLGSGLNHDGTAGTALARRSAYAATLWKDGHAPVILCTGGRTPGYPQSEAAACRDVLVSTGVAGTAIHLEEHSHSTEENAIYSRAIMQAQGWHTSLLVTDPFHMMRAHWMFAAHGIAHYPVPVQGDRASRAWYVNRLVAREVLALQWQALKKVLRVSSTSVPVG